jgi:hypothetical protein
VVAVEKDAMLLLLLHLNREMDRVAMRVESSMC